MTCLRLEVIRLEKLRLEVLRLEKLRLEVLRLEKLRLEVLKSSLSYPLYLWGKKEKEPQSVCPAYECPDAPAIKSPHNVQSVR